MPDQPLATLETASRRLVVIYNPAAGGSKKRLFGDTLKALEARGCQVSLRATGGPGDAVRLAADVSLDEAEVVVAAGGDGTINEVINGLLSQPRPRPALGIIPLGTANVLAAEMGLAKDPGQIAETLCSVVPKSIALGRANDRFFVAMVGAGFDAHVVAGINSKLKAMIGKGAYVWESGRQLIRFAFPSYRITIDGEVHEAASVVVSKGRYYAGRYLLAPEASLADSRLWVCLFAETGPLSVMKFGAALTLNRLPHQRGVRLLPASQVIIEGPEGEPLQGDGDTLGQLPAKIEVVPDALDLLLPI